MKVGITRLWHILLCGTVAVLWGTAACGGSSSRSTLSGTGTDIIDDDDYLEPPAIDDDDATPDGEGSETPLLGDDDATSDVAPVQETPLGDDDSSPIVGDDDGPPPDGTPGAEPVGNVQGVLELEADTEAAESLIRVAFYNETQFSLPADPIDPAQNQIAMELQPTGFPIRFQTVLMEEMTYLGEAWQDANNNATLDEGDLVGYCEPFYLSSEPVSISITLADYQ